MVSSRSDQQTRLVDERVSEGAVEQLRDAQVALPTFAQLADPTLIPSGVRDLLAGVGPDDAHPLNLFRVHWHNGSNRRDLVAIPEHLELPTELTGVDARIVILLGDRFPLIGAHKVLAAYGCLAPGLVTGRFDPTRHRAVWPSTGNYCRGGVAVSRLMGCRGVAVLPEGMSRERFAWLEQWVADPADIVRTPGTESNVKEIYDACKELAADPHNVVFNQFAEFGNHLVHYLATGAALERVFLSLQEDEPGLRLRAFVSATGSAGTIGAGDYLKERFGSLTVAAEALECPTLLRNGFGEHNIQGIGDKHVPLIHNVMATDVALAVSDRATDRLGVLFGTEAGHSHLRRRGVADAVLDELPSLGLSSICNLLGAIKVAKHYRLGADDVVLTIATDGAAMYGSERELALARHFPDGFDGVAAAEAFGEHLLGAAPDNLRELTWEERERIFNLGYFTWVEQQGVSIEDFEARRDPAFWVRLREQIPDWDARIDELNARTGVLETP
ncbi:MAG TPA: pyridoxal-phosphate dependent enzyme [Gaiellaceae bacterium]|nr:pyridoxal-phosphate dependent enzyme [Gaiellaceae bacterium]